MNKNGQSNICKSISKQPTMLSFNRAKATINCSQMRRSPINERNGAIQKTILNRLPQKKEIIERLSAHASEIREGSVVVLYLDECHLLWDDARGYSWAPSTQRVEVPMTNFRERQTYYGAIDPVSGTVHVIPTDNADGNWTMIFVEYLRQEYGEKRLFLLWDGASYHQGVEMQEYLEGVNINLVSDAWRVNCILFEPNA